MKQDSLDLSANNSWAGFAAYIEETRNATEKSDCNSDSTDCTLWSWASKKASSASNEVLSNSGSKENTAALLACSLDSKDCSWALSKRTAANVLSSLDSMANNLGLLVSKQATSDCSLETSASKDSSVNMKPSKLD